LYLTLALTTNLKSVNSSGATVNLWVLLVSNVDWITESLGRLTGCANFDTFDVGVIGKIDYILRILVMIINYSPLTR